MSASLTRRGFLKAAGLIAAGAALLRASPASRAVAPAAPVSPDSAYERMKRIRIDYMLAAGNPQRRYELNRELLALVFEMREAGASRQRIMAIGQKSLYHAQRQVAVLRATG